MSTRQQLYFVAIMLPDTVAAEITEMKKEIAERFSTRKALTLEPHITLKSPFTLDPTEHDKVLEWFDTMIPETNSFTQVLDGFGSFENKSGPVLFIQPVLNDSLLALQKQVLHTFRPAFPSQVIMAPDWKFKPHITLAYRDFLPEKYAEAWPEFQQKTYRASFDVTEFQLLQHNTRKWKTIAVKKLEVA